MNEYSKMYFHLSWSQLIVWLSFLLLSSCSAQSIQQLIWNIPNGKLADLSQTFSAGQTLPLSWNAYSSTQYVDTTKNLVDLWVSAFDFNLNPFSQRLTVGLNLTSPGNFAWTISIPVGNLTTSAKYVLRFKISSPIYNQNNGDLSSPGFLVLQASSASTPVSSSALSSFTSVSSQTSNTISSTSYVSSNSLVSSTLSTSVITVSPSAAVAITTSKPSSNLSSAAKGGIGAGVVVGAFALGGLLYFLFSVQRRKKEKGVGKSISQDNSSGVGYGSNASELPAKVPVAELPSNH